jgi:hypothetical protein
MEDMMKRKNDLVYRLFLATILALLLTSCDFSKVRIGEVRMMYGSNEDGHISYNYSTFTGVENGSIQVEAGGRISFDYRVTVTKGSLLIEWQDPEGEVVWREIIQESEDGEGVITAESSGTYRIIIQGKNAGGDFDIRWQMDEV